MSSDKQEVGERDYSHYLTTPGGAVFFDVNYSQCQLLCFLTSTKSSHTVRCFPTNSFLAVLASVLVGLACLVREMCNTTLVAPPPTNHSSCDEELPLCSNS